MKRAAEARPYTDKVGEEDTDGLDMAYRVVADHIRTLSFAIADGAAPGNEGRDYVLRRVLRRAVRYGDKLGGKLGFFSELVRALVEQMGYFYPELVAKEEHIRQTIQTEETAFGKTLKTGAQVFSKKAAGLPKGGLLDGAVIFELYDAYGYPVDLTELMAEEVGLTCDIEGFEKAMEAAKAKSRAGGRAAAADTLKFEAHATAWLKDHNIPISDDDPKFDVGKDVEAKVMAIMTSSGFVDSAEESEDTVGLVLDTTSFYAESGGQVTDTGVLELQNGGELAVSACAVAASYVLHKGALSGKVDVGDYVKCCVDWQRRAQITPNHTMTHVLNHALRSVCGDHVDQKGSVVLPEKLSFDFSNNGPVSVEQLKQVQEACQKIVTAAQGVYTKVVPLADAHKIYGLRAVFGEAYPDPVRVVAVGKSVDDLLADPENKENIQYSVEFCGGTHMKSTSEAKSFAIIGETAVAQGVRRILAVTADKAEEAFAKAEALSKEVAAVDAQSDPDEAAVKALADRIVRDDSLPTTSRSDIKAQVEMIVKKVLAVKKAKVAEAAKAAKNTAVTAASAAVSAGAKHLVLQLDLPASVSGKAMPEAYTAIKAEHPTLACLLLAPDADAGKCSVYTEVPKDVSKVLSASEWLKKAVGAMGGKGGGKPEKAAGSGPDVAKVADAVKAADEYAVSCLAAEA